MNLPTQDLPIGQWAYAVKQYTITNNNALIQPQAGSQGWRPIRIQLYTGENPSTVSVGGPTTENSFDVAANGCLTLEPSGYMTPFSTFDFTGEGNYVVIEYLYQVRADGLPPIITVTDS